MDGATVRETWVDFDTEDFYVDSCGAGRLEFRIKPKEPEFKPGWFHCSGPTAHELDRQTILWFDKPPSSAEAELWRRIDSLPVSP